MSVPTSQQSVVLRLRRTCCNCTPTCLDLKKKINISGCVLQTVRGGKHQGRKPACPCCCTIIENFPLQLASKLKYKDLAQIIQGICPTTLQVRYLSTRSDLGDCSELNLLRARNVLGLMRVSPALSFHQEFRTLHDFKACIPTPVPAAVLPEYRVAHHRSTCPVPTRAGPVTLKSRSSVLPGATLNRCLQEGDFLKKGVADEATFDVARWLFHLGMVHRHSVRAARRALMPLGRHRLKGSKMWLGDWGQRQRFHQALLPRDAMSAISRLKHLQHVGRRGAHHDKLLRTWCQTFAGVGPIASCMHELTGLELVNVEFLKEEDTAASVLSGVVGKLGRLKELRLCNTGSIVPESCTLLCSMLTKLPMLRVLELTGVSLGCALFVHVWELVPALRSLVSINLSDNRIGHGCKAMHAMSWRDLTAPHLQKLLLHQNDVDDVGADAISGFFQAMPRLGIVTLNSNRMSSQGIAIVVHRLAGCQWLEQLDMSDNEVIDRSPDLSSLPSRLALLPRLRRLDLSGCGLDDAHAAELVQAVPCCAGFKV
jgi:hypothetical protein